MKCFLCKGDTVKSTTTYMTAYKNCYIIIKNVPAFEKAFRREPGNGIKRIRVIIIQPVNL